MGIPKQVQKQSEEVQALYKELNGETENAQVQEQTPATEAPEVPAEQPVEQPSDSVSFESAGGSHGYCNYFEIVP